MKTRAHIAVSLWPPSSRRSSPAAAARATAPIPRDSASERRRRRTKLSLVAYAVPKVGFDKVIPLFQKTSAGQGVTFSQSYGASGDQSRKVAAGLATDVVNFSVEPDVTSSSTRA